MSWMVSYNVRAYWLND